MPDRSTKLPQAAKSSHARQRDAIAEREAALHRRFRDHVRRIAHEASNPMPDLPGCLLRYHLEGGKRIKGNHAAPEDSILVRGLGRPNSSHLVRPVRRNRHDRKSLKVGLFEGWMELGDGGSRCCDHRGTNSRFCRPHRPDRI